MKILHLEDNPLDTELALETLRDEGLEAEIVRVESMQEFAGALETERLDLILADYMVPGVNALRALHLANELRPDVPYVFLSGALSEDLAIETLKLGATDYVFKQRMSRLAPAVRRALREAEDQARRRQAEEEARMFKFFSENANDGLILFNQDTRILYANKLTCERLGYTEEELRQLTSLDINPVFPKEKVQALFRQLKEGRAAPFESVHKRKDGSSFPVEMTCTALEVKGELLMFATSRDITERKQAEQSLRESEQDARTLSHTLEQRVVERTFELEEKTTRLRRLAIELAATEQRERKRLAALLHDDLQQLLVAAKMQLKKASRQMKEDSDRQAVEKAAQWLGEATASARALTHQLRPAALYEDGLIAGLHGLSLEMKKRYQLEVTIDGDDVKRNLSEDTNALLFECTRELLFNTAKHAEVGEACVRVREDHGCLHVIVHDQGKGFGTDVPQSHASEGFGLFSIGERLSALGGEMAIESIPGEGTTIALILPIVPEVLEQAPEQPPARRNPREQANGARDNRVHLLVADDHAMVRQGLATLLNEDERLKVVGEAVDGIAAIEAVANHHPDVLLIDINMPGMNGIEAAREVKCRWPRTIIIGISVQDDDVTAKAMLDAGASAFLSKSGDSTRMIETILDLVKQRS